MLGVVVDDKLLDYKINNFLVVFLFGKKGMVGLFFLDIFMGEFLSCEGDFFYVDKLLQSFCFFEVLIFKDKKKFFVEKLGD